MELISISWIRISYKRMEVIQTFTHSNKLSLNNVRISLIKRTSINLLSFQRSFALISYPCKLSSGFLKALAETRK